MWQKTTTATDFFVDHDFNRFTLYKLQQEISNHPKFSLLFFKYFLLESIAL